MRQHDTGSQVGAVGLGRSSVAESIVLSGRRGLSLDDAVWLAERSRDDPAAQHEHATTGTVLPEAQDGEMEVADP